MSGLTKYPSGIRKACRDNLCTQHMEEFTVLPQGKKQILLKHLNNYKCFQLGVSIK